MLPSLLAEALAANDRLKLGLTLLQVAAAHAAQPTRAVNPLAAERHAAGLNGPEFDSTISGAQALNGDRLRIPGARLLMAGLSRDVGGVLAPLQAAGSSALAILDRRRSALLEAPCAADRNSDDLRDARRWSLPLATARGRLALWHQRQALASMVYLGELLRPLGHDLCQPRADGPDLQAAVAFLLRALEEPALLARYTGDDDAPHQDLRFLKLRGNGRHHMAWAALHRTRFPDRTEPGNSASCCRPPASRRGRSSTTR
ncbi:hypothetical protein BH11PSE3_BH11PSE3_24500 [soil metagenome]